MKFPLHDKRHITSEVIESVSVVGNIHGKRWGWNPFDSEHDLVKVGPSLWQGVVSLESARLPEHSGFYSMRLVLNHNPRRQLKASSHGHDQRGVIWHLAHDPLGVHLSNINVNMKHDGEVLLIFDSEKLCFSVMASGSNDIDGDWIQAVDAQDSYELNGFVWDELSMFEKFQPRRAGRSFTQDPDGAWSIEVPLRTTGGIDFRADGVYQFLISANQEEDFGFACINDGKGTLVSGTGFSSSHGTSMHSGCTIRACKNGTYRFRLVNPTTQPRIEVQDPDGQPVPVLNQRQSIQLLGSIFKDSPFDPTVAGRSLRLNETTGWHEIEMETAAGDHCINFAINGELFLDTMGFGCWFQEAGQEDGKTLSGMAWHGKPQEWNICFSLSANGLLRYSYQPETDEFKLEVLSGPGSLKPVTELLALSLVGGFPEPLVAWNPKDPANLMESLGGGRFQRCVHLKAGSEYSYKYVANQSDWQLVFADYELDGHGTSFEGRNPVAGHPTVSSLKRHGRLTSHGNPPPLSFTPIHSGPYRFYADVITGAYSVQPL